MAATLGPNDNCQLWSEWQVPMCGVILIQTGSCQTGLRLAAAILGPVVAPNPVSQCAIARMATTSNCQSGARVAKICCDINKKYISFHVQHVCVHLRY